MSHLISQRTLSTSPWLLRAGGRSKFSRKRKKTEKKFHRITEQLELEGTLKIIQSSKRPVTGRDSSHQIRLPKAMSSLALNTSLWGWGIHSLQEKRKKITVPLFLHFVANGKKFCSNFISRKHNLIALWVHTSYTPHIFNSYCTKDN